MSTHWKIANHITISKLYICRDFRHRCHSSDSEMASVDRSIIARVVGRFRAELDLYTLANVSEVNRNTLEKHDSDVERFRRGSDAEVIDLDWRGTKCVGKVLHSVFFDVGTEPTVMQRMLEKFFREIKLLKEMRHSNIVRFLGIFYKQDSSLPVLVMEKMECSLTQYLSTHKIGSIPEDQTLNILLDVSKGLVYLHEEMKVAHRDLSSNNILLAADLSAKIADLGSARALDRPGGWNSLAKLTVQPGVQDFMPPEALEDPPKYTVSVDMFSFGCVAVHLHTHRWPSPVGKSFEGKLLTEIERRQKYILEMGDAYLLPMVMHCLEESSTKRPTSKDVLCLLEKKSKVHVCCVDTKASFLCSC